MTHKIKVIKTEEDYKGALNLIEDLMSKNPAPESEEGEKLNLLVTLVQDYESKVFPESLPDPIDAILFRMQQQNLKPTDLIPYIGSRSKVSEILSRKRPLTLSMIRSLEEGLGIPAKVLLKEPDEFRNFENISWDRFPLKEMKKRQYFDVTISKTSDIKSTMIEFLKPLGPSSQFLGMLRKSYYRTVRPMNKHALIAWSAFVVKKANEIKYPGIFKPGSIDLAFMQKLAKLTLEKDSPILAINELLKKGISLVIEPPFPQTYLDGATIMLNRKHPIIGLTLRFDRLDNFWFTLMHELAHISLHNNKNLNIFYDDLDNPETNNSQEVEADRLAREALVPESKWENSPAKQIPSFLAAKSLAKDLGVHIAIIAGKMRHEGNNYMYLNKIVKEEIVRKYFPKKNWSK